MRGRISAPTLGAVMLAMLVLGLPAPSARAQTTDSVTLDASATLVDHGTPVDLTGTISPSQGGQSVQILDGGSAVLATAVTGSDGSFGVSLTLAASTTLTASWGSVLSDPVTIRVRAVVSLTMGRVRLFETTLAQGSIAPGIGGIAVHVSLLRAGRVVARRDVTTGSAGGFRARLPIRKPGTYRVRAVAQPAGLARGKAVAGPASTPLPSLGPGSKSPSVRTLERRLAFLHYHLTGVNMRYDHRTADAVMAFRKVQGMTRVGTVNATLWRRLADPRVPKPRFARKAFHIEVDQTHQVLYTVKGGVVTNVIHVSTGRNGATQDGSFRVYRKLAGYSPNRLYYPSYFDGLRAIHGWTEVPSYPASHGCVRVPYWNARWIFGLATIGTPVLIYH